MEVGAVKQAFNNEVILLKKKLNQAKIQIIHKLTRKAKQLTEKKAPEQLKEKLKRKAESAVKEVLIIKKIKAKDIAKFIVTHKEQLNSYLNKPQVDEDKACARLILHKALQDKHKSIRDRFSNVPIQDLFMSRIERRKMKQEAKEKQKNKKKGNQDKNNKIINSEGNWDVEDVPMANNSKLIESDDDHDKSKAIDDVSSDDNVDNEITGDECDHSERDDDEDEKDTNTDKKVEIDNDSESDVGSGDDEVKLNDKLVKSIPKEKVSLSYVKLNSNEEIKKTSNKTKEVIKSNPPKEVVKKKPVKKQKEANKNKNLNEKMLQRKFKKDTDSIVVENKIVDPFFITATGENYLSVVEPRAPDEIKTEHMQGNRKLRRAVMFGHIPKSKLRQNNNYHREDSRFNSNNGYEKGNNFKGKFNNRTQFNDGGSFKDRTQYNNNINKFNDKRGYNNNNRNNEEKPEKLHPSWEAKKKKSGILPFEGKKIVFDES